MGFRGSKVRILSMARAYSFIKRCPIDTKSLFGSCNERGKGDQDESLEIHNR